MKLTERELLQRLGAGEAIESVCAAAGISRSEFNELWQRSCAARVPTMAGTSRAAVTADVTIERDEWGVPHIYAENDADLFFGYGYAMAQDRLFQMDWLRRKGHGRLAEILGPSGLEFDLIARTVGLNRIAAADVQKLPAETLAVQQAFAAGVNAVIAESKDNLPIEFDLLGYSPEPWSPVDSVVIEYEFAWYLTGRFPVIAMPELARRALGEGPLYQDYLTGEADEESILLPGMYAPSRSGVEAVGQAVGDPDATTGSNNWVVGGALTSNGKPMIASDPHIAFEAVSCWYEAHLSGGSFNVAGMTYVGMPAIMFGRNERVAWGITNNICSLRDLYQEKTDPAHPGCFLYDGTWEPARELTETIAVKGSEPVVRTIKFSRNGPIVDEILPPPANKSGPVSLRWIGMHHGGWLTSLLQIDRAKNVHEFREGLRPWHVPTFCLVFGDVDGGIGMQASGRIPLREIPERGYRPGWDPAHSWKGLIPLEGMPGVINPKRGWMATANNRIAPNDYPYPLHGCWTSGWRCQRIRTMIEEGRDFTREDFNRMQHDTANLRGAYCVPALVNALSGSSDPRIQKGVEHLRAWDFNAEAESVGAGLFNVFFTYWARAVADARFDKPLADLLVKGVEPIATRLIQADPNGWFASGVREQKLVDAFRATLDLFETRFGPDMTGWTWGAVHQMPLKHVLSARGDLGKLLDHGGGPIKGDMTTVCNTGTGADWVAFGGAGYRLIVELASDPPELLAIDAQSHSGHPGSPNYANQLDLWKKGTFRRIPLQRAAAGDLIRSRQTLTAR